MSLRGPRFLPPVAMTTAFRALVMLSVLVGLPAAWIYYGPLPPEAQPIVDRFVGVAKRALGWNATAARPGAARPEIEYLAASPASRSRSSAGRPAPSLPTPPQSAAASPLTVAEQVEPLLERLRELGVVEYVLERWGDGRLYRFRCEMPLEASPRLTQQFEAVTDDPQQCVAQVVAQIDSWRVGRQPTRLTR